MTGFRRASCALHVTGQWSAPGVRAGLGREAHGTAGWSSGSGSDGMDHAVAQHAAAATTKLPAQGGVDAGTLRAAPMPHTGAGDGAGTLSEPEPCTSMCVAAKICNTCRSFQIFQSALLNQSHVRPGALARASYVRPAPCTGTHFQDPLVLMKLETLRAPPGPSWSAHHAHREPMSVMQLVHVSSRMQRSFSSISSSSHCIMSSTVSSGPGPSYHRG